MILRKKSSKGFTLIEAVVAAAIFAFVISSILGVYLYVLRLNTRTRAIRVLTQNARFVTEFMSKEIRNGHIDYTKGNVSAVGTSIWLVNQNDESERIYLYNETKGGEEPTSYNCMTDVCSIKLDKSGASTTLTDNNVKVTNFALVASPNSDPYTRSNGTNVQPHVTLIMQLTSNVGARDAVKMDLQSTYSELYYPGRQ